MLKELRVRRARGDKANMKQDLFNEILGMILTNIKLDYEMMI
jgi:hypothetical protein